MADNELNETADSAEEKAPAWARDQLKSKDEKIAELQKKVRDAEFRDAGINVKEGPGKLFYETYTGEPDKDAIIKAASEYGIVGAGSTEQQRRVDQNENAQRKIDRVMETAADDADDRVPEWEREYRAAEERGDYKAMARAKDKAYLSDLPG